MKNLLLKVVKDQRVHSALVALGVAILAALGLH
jgi:hypothetical protein